MKEVSGLCTEQFAYLYSTLSNRVPSMELVESFVKPLHYMFTLLYDFCNRNKSDMGASDSLYVKALQYIQHNYSGSITCADVAAELQYSPSYVRYIFKRHGNTSVQAKINEIRLNNAKRLLRGTNMSITEIAFSVGFSDSNYFSVFFKRKENMSPREYRNKE